MDRQTSSDGANAGGAALSRMEYAFSQLNRMAQELGPNAQLPTFAELRSSLNVSVVTLNRALEQLEDRRVLYRRHGVGIFVSPDFGRRHIAVLCSPHFFAGPEISPFWQLILGEAQRHAAERNYECTLHFTELDEARDPFYEGLQRLIRDGRVDGVLGVGMSEIADAALAAGNVPAVSFAGAARYQVGVDYHAFIRAATLHLAEQGCERIAFSTPQEAMEYRLPPYQAALQELGRPVDAALIFDTRTLMEEPQRPFPLSMWEQGYRAAQYFFGPERDLSVRPDGIVSPSELFSQGLIIGLQPLGVRLGADVKIASHSNRDSYILRPWEDEITRYEVSPTELAQMMLQSLEILMQGGAPSAQLILHQAVCRLPASMTEQGMAIK